MLNRKQEHKWPVELVHKGILLGAVPARLVNFRSHQASARTYFARFICILPRLSAPGSPRMFPSLQVPIFVFSVEVRGTWVGTTGGTDVDGLSGNFLDVVGDTESICCREEMVLTKPLLVEDRSSDEKTVVEL